MSTEARTESEGPLSGVRVVDLTHALNGPFATMLLAHMGAEVLKIEYGAGDHYRKSWMTSDSERDGYEFMMVNANKKAITLNLKSDRGKQIFLDLVRLADVVVENFSLGVMDRLGLNYEVLEGVNPSIIYASSRGYGDSGPRAHMRANASKIGASTGWTSTAWEISGAPGSRVLGVGDEAGGVSLAIGILAALFARERTGLGQKVEISMQEALLGLMVSTFHSFFERNQVPGVVLQKPGAVPCADGYVAFNLRHMTDEVWQRFAQEIGHPEAIEEPAFQTAADRRTNFKELERLVLTEWIPKKTRAEMERVFDATAMSAAAVMTFGEVMEDPHLRARQSFVEVDDPRSGRLKLLRPWIRFSKMHTGIRRAGPAMGQDNAEVYGNLLGLGDEELQNLAESNTI